MDQELSPRDNGSLEYRDQRNHYSSLDPQSFTPIRNRENRRKVAKIDRAAELANARAERELELQRAHLQREHEVNGIRATHAAQLQTYRRMHREGAQEEIVRQAVKLQQVAAQESGDDLILKDFAEGIAKRLSYAEVEIYRSENRVDYRGF